MIVCTFVMILCMDTVCSSFFICFHLSCIMCLCRGSAPGSFPICVHLCYIWPPLVCLYLPCCFLFRYEILRISLDTTLIFQVVLLSPLSAELTLIMYFPIWMLPACVLTPSAIMIIGFTLINISPSTRACVPPHQPACYSLLNWLLIQHALRSQMRQGMHCKKLQLSQRKYFEYSQTYNVLPLKCWQKME